jgi:hypothetical protein
LNHLFDNLQGNLITVPTTGHTGSQLYHVDCFPPIGSITGKFSQCLLLNLKAHLVEGFLSYAHDFILFQGTEEDLQTPGAQGRRNLLRHSGGRSHQAKIRRKAMLEHVVDMSGDVCVIFIIVGALQYNLAVL